MLRTGCNALYPYGPLTDEALFTPEATREACHRLLEAGYGCVEYSHAFRFTLDEARALGRYASSLGLEAWSIHAGGPGGLSVGSTVEEAQASLAHCLEVCSELGARVMVVHPVHCSPLRRPDATPEAQRLEQDLRILEPVCTRARELGLEIALENGATLVDMGYLLRLGQALGGPHVGYCIDTGHANLGDLGAARAVAMAGPRLYTTHLQDNHGLSDEHLPPGAGAIDWTAVFAALKAAGYARPLMLELTDGPDERPYNPDGEMKQGAQNVRRFAAQAQLS